MESTIFFKMKNITNKPKVQGLTDIICIFSFVLPFARMLSFSSINCAINACNKQIVFKHAKLEKNALNMKQER